MLKRAVAAATVLFVIFPTFAQPGASRIDGVPDHVCLPSVSEEDAAWAALQHELTAAAIEFDAIDAPARAAFEVEEKKTIRALIKHKAEVQARYDKASEETYRLNPTRYPCTNAEVHSKALVLACQRLAMWARWLQVAGRGRCRDISPSNHEAYVEDGNPCEQEAKQYWKDTTIARAKYQQRADSAERAYRQKMMPACSIWQRITFKELDRPTLRARQQCLTDLLSPVRLTQCTEWLSKAR